MAEEVKKGIESVEGVEAVIYQVPEILPAEVLEKMHAPAKANYPIITAANLTEADGFVFGFPTRFGMMCSQMKAFFDSTGQLWQSGALHGKPASLFTSSGCQGGGQETTIMTAVSQLAHHGMIYVPTGFAAGAGMFNVETARGGSAWGAGTLAGPTGGRQPSEIELTQAKVQGTLIANVAKKLKA
eukprot:CAMPEP_0175054266 /NCGR_PEP_ID=MMETSP0052_2-20121109/9409_1 /TAXON_ID=51329 ORGANISM="Polytomella parva, Strain SAG 63-3" /NCGR_SAMPLE_ID=MMETSP0052_2 /ASSEMBLY_ACC=CAM_ASM_000194 /LENGTH=184 /DNA_ID=CAMNT_0016318941 /DNA_START=325 /DNA_END=879 /DNA_ORIENTATION=-